MEQSTRVLGAKYRRGNKNRVHYAMLKGKDDEKAESDHSPTETLFQHLKTLLDRVDFSNQFHSEEQFKDAYENSWESSDQDYHNKNYKEAMTIYKKKYKSLARLFEKFKRNTNSWIKARKQVEQHLGKKEKTKYRWHTRKAFLTLNDDVKRDIIKDE